MRHHEECAGCFRRRGEEEPVESWTFWEMCGASSAKTEKDRLCYGAWLCSSCYVAQQKRLKVLSRVNGSIAKPKVAR